MNLNQAIEKAKKILGESIVKNPIFIVESGKQFDAIEMNSVAGNNHLISDIKAILYVTNDMTKV